MLEYGLLNLGSILVLGIFAQWFAWRIKLPAIFPLLLIGFLVGPIAQQYFGGKFIDPELIFADKTLFYFVSLSVGVILFEGGLTLKFKEVKQHIGVVSYMMFFGSLIMTLGGALSAWYFLDMDYRLALLFGSLIIVTGPTVIAPILKSVKPTKNIATILKWEGILIDPVGALVAVLIYEWFFVASLGGAGTFLSVMKIFGLLVFEGTLVGVVIGGIMYYVLKKEWIPDSLVEVMSLAFVVLAFAFSDFLIHESGLLAVTVLGVMLANLDTPKIGKIMHFKEAVTVLLISILFIMLSANINFKELQLLGKPTIIIFAIVVLVLRPLTVFLSTFKSNLSFKEKLFISWIGPKGIVAAAVAALFSLYLSNSDNFTLPPSIQEDVKLLVPLTFAIILGTVTLNGLFSKPIAIWLDVVRKQSKGVLIAGANDLAIELGVYLQKNGINVLMMDTSSRNVNNALSAGLRARKENVLSESIEDILETEDIGNFYALTPANDVNIFACRKFSTLFGKEHVNRLVTTNESVSNTSVRPDDVLFGLDVDFWKLMDIYKKFGKIKEAELKDENELMDILKAEDDDVIPLFLKKKEGDLEVIQIDFDVNYQKGDMLSFMGNEETLKKMKKSNIGEG